MTTRTKEDVIQLVFLVKEGDNEAFRELESVAKPLLVSISNRFSNYHYKFEFEDFYNLSLYAMHEACLEYNEGNPSFLDYAKVFILNKCLREVEHWNQGKRNIFKVDEIGIEEISGESYQDDEIFEGIYRSDFRRSVNEIIDNSFGDRNGDILRMYIIENKKISVISSEMGMNYKSVYSIAKRGMKKIANIYIKDNVYT